jgi:hypothetical protein
VETDKEPVLDIAWTKLLKAYGQLKLTKLTDTLPALSGFARYAEHLRPGQYLAGMWERDIAMQLAWQRKEIQWGGPQSSLDSPSLSWISASYGYQWIRPSSGYTPRCTFISATSTLATANPYGHVPQCSITLRDRTIQGAKLSPLVWFNGPRPRARQGTPIFTAVMDNPSCELDQTLLDAIADSDVKGRTLDPPSVLCLELFQESGSTDRSYRYPVPFDATALVLQRNSGGTNHTRLGIMRNVNPQ